MDGGRKVKRMKEMGDRGRGVMASKEKDDKDR